MNRQWRKVELWTLIKRMGGRVGASQEVRVVFYRSDSRRGGAYPNERQAQQNGR